MSILISLDMKFVYFDIGGVLIEDFSGTSNWDLLTKEWGIIKKEDKEKIDRLFNIFEKEADLGRNVEEFLPLVEKNFKIKFPKNYSINKDFVGRFCRNEKINEIINKIKDKYKLGLLTNMYPKMLDLIRKNNLIPNVNWSIIIDSSVEKCIKPDKKIYEIAEKKCGFKTEDILFIDNREENLEVPKKMGWQTYWYDSNDYEKSNWKLSNFLR